MEKILENNCWMERKTTGKKETLELIIILASYTCVVTLKIKQETTVIDGRLGFWTEAAISLAALLVWQGLFEVLDCAVYTNSSQYVQLTVISIIVS